MKDLKQFLWEKDLEENKSSMLTVYCDMDGVLADFEPALVTYFNNFFDAYSKGNGLCASYLKEAGIYSTEATKYLSLLKYVYSKLGRYYITRTDLRPKFKKLEGDSYANEDHKAIPNPLSFLTYRMIYNNYSFWKTIPWTPYGRFIWETLFNFSSTFSHINLRVLTTPMLKLGQGHGCFTGKQYWAYTNLTSEHYPDVHENYDLIFEKNKEKYAHKNSLLIDDSVRKCDAFRKAGGQVIKIDPLNFDIDTFKDRFSKFFRREKL